ncbi:MAG: lipocalin family protein [Gammaproteobacteria bacterium]
MPEQRPGRARLGAALVAVLLALTGGAAAAPAALETVDDLHLGRYAGRWYQIALLPNRFQAFCVGETRATYTLREDGRVAVLNECRDDDGEMRAAEGVARRNGRYGDPARLEVRFAPAFLSLLPFVWGDYWVMDIEPDYSAVLVGAPSRDYLWVLARDTSMSAAVYRRFLERAAADGFPVEAIRREPGTTLSEPDPTLNP